jgi:hypothetical protein
LAGGADPEEGRGISVIASGNAWRNEWENACANGGKG